MKGRRRNALTGSKPIGINGGAKNIEEVVLRRVRYKIREPMAFFPVVEWFYSVCTTGLHHPIVALGYGDLLGLG